MNSVELRESVSLTDDLDAQTHPWVVIDAESSPLSFRLPSVEVILGRVPGLVWLDLIVLALTPSG